MNFHSEKEDHWNNKHLFINGLLLFSVVLFLLTLIINPSPVQDIPKIASGIYTAVLTPVSLAQTTTPFLAITATSTLIYSLTSTPDEIPSLSTPQISTPTIQISVPNTETQLSPAAKNGLLIVHFIDVGQGDSILIETPDERYILIDGGDPNGMALNYLQVKGVKKLDLIIATHPHEDHIGGLVEVLNTIPVAKVITNGEIYTTITYENFLDAISNAGAEYSEVKSGDVVSVGSLSFFVLSPHYIDTNNVNNNSIVLRLVYNNVSFLFMGDAEYEAESSIMRSGVTLKSNIMKIGHHGSNTSSMNSFINIVHPAIAIYSAGFDNSYDLPDLPVLKRFSSLGASIYGTDINGTIIVSTDGTSYQINTTKQSEAIKIP
jgi:competence protein ComEC